MTASLLRTYARLYNLGGWMYERTGQHDSLAGKVPHSAGGGVAEGVSADPAHFIIRTKRLFGCRINVRCRGKDTQMRFEWDPEKAQRNETKHGISFMEASTVFGDDYSSTVADPDHSEGEERYLTFGMSSSRRALVVAHTDRGANYDPYPRVP